MTKWPRHCRERALQPLPLVTPPVLILAVISRCLVLQLLNAMSHQWAHSETLSLQPHPLTIDLTDHTSSSLAITGHTHTTPTWMQCGDEIWRKKGCVELMPHPCHACLHIASIHPPVSTFWAHKCRCLPHGISVNLSHVTSLPIRTVKNTASECGIVPNDMHVL